MALVVTIIVLLILVAVAINLTIGNNGIFTRAENAIAKYEEASINEQLEMNKIVEDIDKLTGNYKPSREGLKVGQYVEYVPDTYVNPEDSSSNYTLTTDISGYTSEQQIAQLKELKWRIMSINADGTVEIVSDNTYDSGTRICFKGATGYNNGVYILNDIAEKQYSNKSLNAVARSMTIEDIEKKMNEKGIAERDRSESNNGTQYGHKKKYTGSNSYYPKLYAEENGSGINTEEVKDDGIGGSVEGSENFPVPSTENPAYEQAIESGLTVTQNYYYMIKSDMSEYFDEENQNFYELIFDTVNYYWLASRYFICYSTYANFGIRNVGSNSLDGNVLFFSNCEMRSGNYGLRAIVSLGSEVEFTEGDGSEQNPYKLSI